MPSKATGYEKRKAKEHRAKHIGGPGNPDYVRGNNVGEVKNRKSPVTRPELKRLAARGVTEIDSMGGFTQPAVQSAKARGIKLFSRRRRIS